MKRTSILLLAVTSFVVAACGATTQPDPQTSQSVEVLGPNDDGEFYVVGLSSAAPHADVQVGAATQTTVTSDESGSFAARVVGEVDGAFTILTGGVETTVHAATPEKVNINTASSRGLESLPAIGEVLASRIVAYRSARGLYADLDELLKVDGIGPVTLETITPWVEADINLNAATRTQLMALPTIGTVRADAIIAWRDTFGPFENVEQLMDVPGIGVNEFDAVHDFVAVGESPSEFPGADLININTATVDLLTELDGIGPARATAIVDFRDAQGLFVAKDALLYVPGIGPATLEKIRDRITVGVLDINEGTFLGNATWTYADDGVVLATGMTEDMMVTSHYGVDTAELVLTFVGSAACVETTNCAPVALKGVLADDGSHDFQLLGFLPAGDGLGEFTVAYTSSNAGALGEDGLELTFVAVRGLETYTLDLTAGRVLQ